MQYVPIQIKLQRSSGQMSATQPAVISQGASHPMIHCARVPSSLDGEGREGVAVVR